MSALPGPIKDPLGLLEAKIGYQFENRSHLQAAVTHASGASHRLASNERMEFLGDAILGAVVCELVFHRFPDFLEGDMTKIKSFIVSRQLCAKISRSLDIESFLVLGRGMLTQSSLPDSVLADVFESLVAAIYLDGGYNAASVFIERLLGPEIDAAAEVEHVGNYKSLLQQTAQRDLNAIPVYQLLDEKGPDHNKCFKIAAQIGKSRYQPAWGRNKKEAEQRAAFNALCELNGDPVPYPTE